MSILESNDPGGERETLRALRSSTILSRVRSVQRIPANVIDFFRGLVDPSEDDPALSGLSNPYAFAKARLNKIWAGRKAYADDERNPDPLAKLRTARGAMTAYFTSEKWKQAWLQTGILAGLATVSSANTVWMAEAYASVISAFSRIDPADAYDSLGLILGNAKDLMFYTGVQVASAWGLSRAGGHLERNMALWMTGKFREAALAEADMVHRITHNRGGAEEDPDLMPDAPHQRIFQAPAGMSCHLVGMGIRGYIAVLTTGFVGLALAQNSVPIEPLDRLSEQLTGMAPGEYGTFLVSLGVIGGYLLATAPGAFSISEKLKNHFKAKDSASGKVMETLVQVFNNGESMAASRGHGAVDRALDAGHRSFDKAWAEQNRTFANYVAFMQGQHFTGENIISFIPALAGLLGPGGKPAAEDFVKTAFETQRLVASLLSSMSYVIDVLPQYAEMKAHAERVAEMAQMFEKAADRRAFFRLSGIHEFEYGNLPPDSPLALRLKGLELMHRGELEPFLTVADMEIKRGERVHIRGEYGSGKSSMTKAMAGIWPYGKGSVETRPDARVFFAYQKPDLSGPHTLAEHVAYGDLDIGRAGKLSDEGREKIDRILDDVGLGEFLPEMNERGRGGKSWDTLFSGGQRNKLVLARLLYQKPDLIFLDEPTAALDPETKADYFRLLSARLPEATVLAITHDENMPEDHAGRPFFHRRISLDGGRAEIGAAGGGMTPQTRPCSGQP